MEGEIIIPKTQHQAERFHKLVLENLGKDAYIRHRDYSKRSLDQNALSHVWYAQIAEQKGDESPEDIRRHCKAYYGVPILLRDSQAFREKWSRLIKNRFSTEEKLELMGWFPVTSLMTKKQMAEYIQTIQNEFGKQGIVLNEQAL